MSTPDYARVTVSTEYYKLSKDFSSFFFFEPLPVLQLLPRAESCVLPDSLYVIVPQTITPGYEITRGTRATSPVPPRSHLAPVLSLVPAFGSNSPTSLPVVSLSRLRRLHVDSVGPELRRGAERSDPEPEVRVRGRERADIFCAHRGRRRAGTRDGSPPRPQRAAAEEGERRHRAL